MKPSGAFLLLTRALLAACTCVGLFGCGGGGNHSQLSSLPSGANVADVTVDGSLGFINTPFITLKLCTPGTSQCVTVDHILVDTGSTGLRVMGSLLSGITLPAATDSNNHALYNCVQFVDGYSYGPVKRADLYIAGEGASSLAIHVIDDSQQPNPPNDVPTDCSNGTPSINSVDSFGANGVLGIGSFREDCGTACTNANNPLPGWYYTCTSLPCSAAAVTPDEQLHNPVVDLSLDNNGAILQFPPISSAGASGGRGVLIFGIGTQTNNQLGNIPVIGLDTSTGRFSTTYKGATYAQSLFDSGSNAYFFNDASLTECTSSAAAGFYCPATVQALTATAVSATNSSSTDTINFNIANAEALTNNQPTFVAFNNLGGTLSSLANTFDWGMPFFYGRSVYIAIEGQSTPAGTGPYVAFK
jgi:hypothetical protein